MTGLPDDPAVRIDELERQLAEANATLDAIRNGEVDAIVVGGATGQFVYTLDNADRPYRILVEQMKEGAVTLNEDGLILYANKSFCDMIGRAAGDLVGSSLADHMVDGTPLLAMLPEAGSGQAEIGLRSSAGPPVAANMSITEIRVEDGAPRMLCGIFTDITEIRRAEDTIRQVQKMDAVGQLTGGIAHDFNNLLMAILSSLGMLEKRLPDDLQIRRLLENARQGAQRGAALTQRMLAFARRQDLKPEPVDLHRLVHGMIDLVERTLGPAWSLRLEVPERLPRVVADANQLEMALLNLAVNARDAMPGGGVIRIVAEQSYAETETANGLAPGNYLCLSVVDTGEGMDEATLRRATEPFFTTKGVGKGTGLGLSMVHGLAEQLNGTFDLRSAIGEGTTACLWLPAAEEWEDRPAATDESPVASVSPTMKVLAVDDDVLIRMNICAMLEDMGHEVVEAGSGDVALELLNAHGDIDLLITDQAMPNMTGLELIERVAAADPQLPIILATGFGELPTSGDSRVVKLGKPFSERELAQAVEAAMALAAD